MARLKVKNELIGAEIKINPSLILEKVLVKTDNLRISKSNEDKSVYFLKR